MPNRASKSALASGAAARLPWPPCSTKTTTTIVGSSTGPKPANQAWSCRRARSAPARIAVSRPTTWTVPVLPPISHALDTRAERRAARLVDDRPHRVLDDPRASPG